MGKNDSKLKDKIETTSKKDQVNTLGIRYSSWYKLLIQFVLWAFLWLLIIVMFYQALPVVLLALGHILFMFGNADIEPTIIDLSIYVLTGFSLTLFLTYIFIHLQKNVYHRAVRLSREMYRRILEKVKRK